MIGILLICMYNKYSLNSIWGTMIYYEGIILFRKVDYSWILWLVNNYLADYFVFFK